MKLFAVTVKTNRVVAAEYFRDATLQTVLGYLQLAQDAIAGDDELGLTYFRTDTVESLLQIVQQPYKSDHTNSPPQNSILNFPPKLAKT
ncbi:MAG: hypothetical protein Q8K50_24245 [Hydrogenophaga sp.]|nr:hypothetical protein [Hydrogenophaga sp.]